MAISRLRFLFGGAALVTITGILSARVFLSEFFGHSFTESLFFSASVVLSPLILIPAGLSDPSQYSSILFAAVGVVVLLAFPIGPLVRPRWFGRVGLVGLLLWISCQVFYAVLLAKHFGLS
jgi:hypothetical protein